MVLILSESDVVSILSMTDAVPIVEQAFADFARGDIIQGPRIIQDLQGSGGALRVVSAVAPKMGAFGVKTLTGVPGRRKRDDTFFAVLLFEIETGALRAIIAANYLTGIRTGAATGVAAKYLSRNNAHIHGVLGAGTQAKFQVLGVSAVRQIDLVKIFAPDFQKASRFADSLKAEFGINAHAVSRARDAVAECDIVTAITTSREPVVLGDWLAQGTHLTSAGANALAKMELDSTCFVRSKVVSDSTAVAMTDAGDLRAVLASGDVTPQHLHAELGEIINGTKVGRSNDQELTLFKSIGLGLQDVSVAAFLLNRATESGTGTLVDLDGANLANSIAPFSIA